MAQSEQLEFRTPTQRDGIAMWRSRRPDGLSPYGYFALLHHLAGTSVVAELDGEVVGFLIARPASGQSIEIIDGTVDAALPSRRTVFFQMLARLIELSECRGALYVDTTSSCDHELVQALMGVQALPLAKCATA